MTQIVRRDGDAYFVSWEDSDVMPSHTPRQLGANHGSALIHLDRVLAPAQGVLNHAFHLEKITFAHECR